MWADRQTDDKTDRHDDRNTMQMVGWEINIPFSTKIGYIGDKVLGGDLVQTG